MGRVGGLVGAVVGWSGVPQSHASNSPSVAVGSPVPREV